MPLVQISRDADSELKTMEDRLVQEWTNPQEDSAEPIIIEESEGRQAPANVYVIWSEWAEVSQYLRTKIILSAYERVKGGNLSLDVIDAMGFTAAEADRAGISY